MFPKNEKHRFSVSDMFSKLLQPCFFQWSKAVCVNFHRPTYQEFTPTSNIALLILCSRQAIVPLCRPGGVRAARFNNYASRLLALLTRFARCWTNHVASSGGFTCFVVPPYQIGCPHFRAASRTICNFRDPSLSI